MVASLPITCAAIMATASGTTGLTLPGMMLLPGCSAGQRNFAEARQRSAVHPAQVIRYFHETHAKDLELSGQFHRRVLAGQCLEIVVAGAKIDAA